MKIRLLKKWRIYVTGTTLEVADPVAKGLIQERTAERYLGEYPPKQKMKTELFKPKNITRDGKGKRK
jgi:hypothetical protein